MADFKTGDGVMIVSRETTPEDVKTGMYFDYFGGLTGKVDRVYDDGTVCVDVDIESLTEDARDRHLAMQEAERKRWLDGLSGEARNRLTEEQRQLKISYKLLVSQKDLEPHKGGKPKGASGKAGKSQAAAEGEDKGSADSPDPATSSSGGDDEPRRLTEADLAAREEEFLKSLQNRQ